MTDVTDAVSSLIVYDIMVNERIFLPLLQQLQKIRSQRHLRRRVCRRCLGAHSAPDMFSRRTLFRGSGGGSPSEVRHGAGWYIGVRE